jgi:hypothetical protein
MSKFKKDWFGRSDEDSYLSKSDKNKLFDWDEGLGKAGSSRSFSSYFLRNQKGLKDSARMVGSMFSVLGVPKKATYTSSKASGSSSDVPKIQIPLKMLQNEEGEFIEHDPELLDAFYGAAIQNGALAAMQTTSEYNYTINKKNISTSKSSVKDLLFSIVNTERIEGKVAERFPGYAKFLRKNKEHQYKDYKPLGEEEDKQKRLFELVVQMLRYPGEIEPETLEEFAVPIANIERMIKRRGGLPTTIEQCKGLATSLYNIIEKYELEEKEEEEEGGEKPGMAGRGELDEMAKTMMEGLMSSPNGDSATDAMLEEFKEGMNNAEKKTEFNRSSEPLASSPKLGFIIAPENKIRYLKVRERVDTTKASVLARLFARRSKDQALVIKSMRSGRLDTNKIAEAAQNVPTIYERYGSIKTNKICVGVLIDESGSMSGQCIQKAQEAAIFINEIFKKMNDVQLFIYGHTADTGKFATTVMIYKEPGTNMPFALGSVEARSNNRDGDAILGTARRIRSMTENQGILFVISDGQPAASGYGGQTGIDDTREKVKKAESLGFQVIQIAIHEHVPSAEMFTHFVKMTDIATFPKTFVNYMSRKVDSMIKERVTM